MLLSIKLRTVQTEAGEVVEAYDNLDRDKRTCGVGKTADEAIGNAVRRCWLENRWDEVTVINIDEEFEEEPEETQ